MQRERILRRNREVHTRVTVDFGVRLHFTSTAAPREAALLLRRIATVYFSDSGRGGRGSPRGSPPGAPGGRPSPRPRGGPASGPPWPCGRIGRNSSSVILPSPFLSSFLSDSEALASSSASMVPSLLRSSASMIGLTGRKPCPPGATGPPCPGRPSPRGCPSPRGRSPGGRSPRGWSPGGRSPAGRSPPGGRGGGASCALMRFEDAPIASARMMVFVFIR